LVEHPVGRARVQYRSTNRGELADILCGEPGDAVVRFDRPQRSLAPGQLAVFYRRHEVLGSGTIARAWEGRAGK
jgi:tRNA U34 2-thiouridine synthase MnmA/TrmU